MIDAAEPTTYKLDELAKATGISVRTIRYYVQRGLLQAPAFRGKDTVYSDEHALRLRAIRRLQAAHYPLDAIVVELERRTADELEELADGKDDVGKRWQVDSVSNPTSQPNPTSQTRAGAPSVRWVRYELLPGLELNLAEDASPAARRLAARLRRIRDSHGPESSMAERILSGDNEDEERETKR